VVGHNDADAARRRGTEGAVVTTWPKAPPLADDVQAYLKVLEPDECWSRLATTSVGRLAAVGDDGVILVLPVNFLVDERSIVFRTAPGAVLDHLHRGPVTFQVDAVDPNRHVGWSVLVHGRAVVDAQPCDHGAAPEPWAPGPRRHVVRIHASRITGRELCAAAHEWDPRGYL
jgi:hypothetical protein